jgi:hypothetical protein
VGVSLVHLVGRGFDVGFNDHHRIHARVCDDPSNWNSVFDRFMYLLFFSISKMSLA